MVAPRPLRLVLAACAAWLLVYELRVLLAPDLEIGPLFSRFAHDVVLVARRGRLPRPRAPRARAPSGSPGR